MRFLLLLLSAFVTVTEGLVMDRRSLGMAALLSLTTWPASVFASESSSSNTQEYVKDKIEASDVVVFAKSYCPFCKKTRQLLTNLHMEQTWSLDIIDIDTMEKGQQIQAELLNQTGQKTVPNIFIAGQHVGGNNDLQELYRSGELEQRLADLDGSMAEEM